MSGTPILSTGSGDDALSLGTGDDVLSVGPAPTPPLSGTPVLSLGSGDEVLSLGTGDEVLSVGPPPVPPPPPAPPAAMVCTPTPLTCAQILAIILPLMPEGNPPQYVNGCPPNFPIDQPGATPLFPPALPPQPIIAVAAIGDAYMSATVPVFAKGLPRFEDSNPEPFDGWAIDNPGWYSGGG